jgi:histone H3/H4
VGDMMTTAEKDRFEVLDGVVKKGQTAFVDVGLALAEIRDKRLFRAAGLSSFEAYCNEYRGITRRHADNLIQATKVRTAVLKTLPGDVSFKAAKAVADVPEEDQQDVVDEAVESAKSEGRSITAPDVKKAAANVQAKREPVGDPDDKQLDIKRKKTVKTLEAAMREFDDLQTMKACREYKEIIEQIKLLIKMAKEWK